MTEMELWEEATPNDSSNLFQTDMDGEDEDYQSYVNLLKKF